MANRLAQESSPYLLQHANNPVDWHAWGPEALDLARTTDRPIFLSIGYSACHWCHVMEHESFEDPAIARLMNEHFVCIKVDREERPDLDQVYMSAVQIMTGRGGWPMSVFLTPRLQPFYGGTYWPPTARMGMPGFDQVLSAVAEAWRERRPQALEQASDLANHIREVASPPVVEGELNSRLLDAAAASLARAFDPQFGGFGRAPKFPHPMDLRLLLHVWRRSGEPRWLEMVTLTLDRMAGGGIYDQLGGGFHRYSVDERWLVPHFEKMLYDNALLTSAYSAAYLATGRDRYARVVRETCDYVLREMTDPAGGFYSTQDADSEGEEGKFFLWTPAEVAELLGPAAAETFCRVYDVSPAGNFEGRNILNLPEPIDRWAQTLGRSVAELQSELDAARQTLLAARENRVRPARDDKVLVSWNGLMIEGLCLAGAALGEPRYIEAAARSADFLLAELRGSEGRLLHSWRGGRAKLAGYLDDYGALLGGLLALYEANFAERYVDAACELADALLTLFRDERGGGFFYTASDHEQLIVRTKDLFDNATPSGNALAATAFVRLGKLTGRGDYLAAGEQTLRTALGVMQQSPGAAGQMLLALDLFWGPTPEIVMLGDPTKPATQQILVDLRRRFWPNKIVALRSAAGRPNAADPSQSPHLAPIFAGKQTEPDATSVFICEGFACQAPVTGRDAARQAFDACGGKAAPA